MMNYNNEEDIKGRTGEQIVYDWLIDRGNTVTDVTSNSTYQKIDNDFIVNDTYLLEVKVDQRIAQTGNVYVEIGYAGADWQHSGWIDYCKADYLAKVSYDNVGATIYFFDFRRLLKLVKTNNIVKSRFEETEQKTQLYSLVKLNDLENNKILLKKVTIDRKAGAHNGNTATRT